MNDADRRDAASWWLQGESIVAVLRHARGQRPVLPAGLVGAPGPLLLTATCFTGSPYGPFLELTLATPARLGARVALCRTLVVVDRPDVQRDSRVRWGFPATLGRLEWSAQGDERVLTWLDRDVQVVGSVRRPALPWATLQRTLQRRGTDNVVAPARLRGLAHPCTVRVDAAGEVPPELRGAALDGRHLGAVLTGVHARIQPARTRAVVNLGRRSSASPEPAMYRPSSRVG